VCSIHSTMTSRRVDSVGGRATLGSFLRERREALRREDRRYSLRQVAGRVGIEPSYLSKVERDIGSPPSEETLVRLAGDLGEDPDVVLALAGKISSDLAEAIRRRPRLFGELIRELRDAPDRAVLRVVREVRDGEW
jgi:transcriptional regulator with XRE-family HTH domain